MEGIRKETIVTQRKLLTRHLFSETEENQEIPQIKMANFRHQILTWILTNKKEECQLIDRDSHLIYDTICETTIKICPENGHSRILRNASIYPQHRYLKTVSTATNGRMKLIEPNMRYYPIICLEGLMKTKRKVKIRPGETEPWNSRIRHRNIIQKIIIKM